MLVPWYQATNRYQVGNQALPGSTKTALGAINCQPGSSGGITNFVVDVIFAAWTTPYCSPRGAFFQRRGARGGHTGGGFNCIFENLPPPFLGLKTGEGATPLTDYLSGLCRASRLAQPDPSYRHSVTSSAPQGARYAVPVTGLSDSGGARPGTRGCIPHSKCSK